MVCCGIIDESTHFQIFKVRVDFTLTNAQNLSYRLKVSEFADWPTCESVSQCTGYKPNNVMSDLEHLRTHEYIGEPLWMPRTQPYMGLEVRIWDTTGVTSDAGVWTASSQGRPTAPSNRTSQRGGDADEESGFLWFVSEIFNNGVSRERYGSWTVTRGRFWLSP